MLVGERARAAPEDRARLEDRDVVLPMRAVVACDVEQRAEDRRAQHRLIGGHRVLQLHERAQRVALGRQQAVRQSRVGERPADDLQQAVPDERVLGMPAQDLLSA